MRFLKAVPFLCELGDRCVGFIGTNWTSFSQLSAKIGRNWFRVSLRLCLSPTTRDFNFGAFGSFCVKMKVSTPLPPKKRSITFNYDISATLAEVGLPSLSVAGRRQQKELRRVPHIFSKVLELPFGSEADVSVQENHDCFRFALVTDEITEDVEAHFVEIVPGISKILIRGRNSLELSFDELELDVWRFRLPPSAKLELATAAYIEGQLIVTVPKSKDFSDYSASDGEEEENDSNRDDDSWEGLLDADIHGDYHNGGGGASANESGNGQEFDWEENVGRSNISSLQHLVLVR